VLPGAPNEINVDSATRNTVVQKLDSKVPITVNIFNDLYGIVYRELQHDAFPRYIRSQQFTDFITKKGESFLKQIAYDLRDSDIQDRILYQPDDFQSTAINDRDIKMILNLNEDSSDWKLISSDAEPFQVYKSKRQYAIGQTRQFRLCKVVGTLPISYDKAILAEINPSTRPLLDKMSCENIVLDYVKIGEKNDNPLANFVVRTGMNYSPIIPRWYYNFVMTVVHDGERQCYMHMGKSSCIYNEMKKDENAKKHGRYADLLYGYTYYKVGENKTRYIHVFFVEQHMKIPEGFNKYMTMQRGKDLHAGYAKVIEEMQKRDFVLDDTEFSLYRTLEEFRNKYEANGEIKTWTLDAK
jgi:hypothetical protein